MAALPRAVSARLLPCTCPARALAPRRLLASPIASTSTVKLPPLRPRSHRYASSAATARPSLLERIKDLRYDVRRLYRKAQQRRGSHEWEVLVVGIVAAQLLVYAAWKLAKGLDLVGRTGLDDFLRKNVLLSWESLTTGRIWTLVTASFANHGGLHTVVNLGFLIPCLPLALDHVRLPVVLGIYLVSGAVSTLTTALWAHWYQSKHGAFKPLTTDLELDEETGRYKDRHGPAGQYYAGRQSIYDAIPGRNVGYAEGASSATYGIISFVLSMYRPRYAQGVLIPGYYFGPPWQAAFVAGLVVDLWLAHKRTDTTVLASSQLGGVAIGLLAARFVHRLK